MEIFKIVCLAIVILAIPVGVVQVWKKLPTIIAIIETIGAIMVEVLLLYTISNWICQLN